MTALYVGDFTCLQDPSPASTRNVACGSRSEMHETLRFSVGAPEDVPSHVTAMPVLAAAGSGAPDLAAPRGSPAPDLAADGGYSAADLAAAPDLAETGGSATAAASCRLLAFASDSALSAGC